MLDGMSTLNYIDPKYSTGTYFINAENDEQRKISAGIECRATTSFQFRFYCICFA